MRIFIRQKMLDMQSRFAYTTLVVWGLLLLIEEIEKMKSWTKLLPFFVVSWYAKKNLQVFEIEIGGKKVKVVRPYKGVYIKVGK